MGKIELENQQVFFSLVIGFMGYTYLAVIRIDFLRGRASRSLYDIR